MGRKVLTSLVAAGMLTVVLFILQSLSERFQRQISSAVRGQRSDLDTYKFSFRSSDVSSSALDEVSRVLPSLVMVDRGSRPKVAAHVTGSFVPQLDQNGGGSEFETLQICPGLPGARVSIGCRVAPQLPQQLGAAFRARRFRGGRGRKAWPSCRTYSWWTVSWWCRGPASTTSTHRPTSDTPTRWRTQRKEVKRRGTEGDPCCSTFIKRRVFFFFFF